MIGLSDANTGLYLMPVKIVGYTFQLIVSTITCFWRLNLVLSFACVETTELHSETRKPLRSDF